MEWQEFKSKLDKAQLTIDELSEILNVSKNTIYSWNSRKSVPYWASSWLDNYIKAKNMEHYKSLLLDILKEMGDDILNKYVGNNLTRNLLLQEVIISADDDDPRLGILLQKLKELKKGRPHKRDQESASLNEMTISRDELQKMVTIALDQLFDSRVEQLKEELLKRLKKEIEKDKKSD